MHPRSGAPLLGVLLLVQAPTSAPRTDGDPPASSFPSTRPAATGIAGVARDAKTGAPLDRFEVSVRLRRSHGAKRPDEKNARTVAVSAGDGAFRVEELSPGDYDVQCSADRYAVAVVKCVEVRRGRVTDGVAVALHRAGTVRGRVLDDATGQALGHASVALVYADGPDVGPAVYWGGAGVVDTSFEFARVKPGRVRVLARRDARVPAASDVFEVKAEETVEIPPLRLRPGGAVEGIARDASGNVLRRAFVMGIAPISDPVASLWSDTHAVRRATSDADGRFRFEGLTPGRWEFVAGFNGTVFVDDVYEATRAYGTAEVIETKTATVELGAPPAPKCAVVGKVTRRGRPATRWLFALRVADSSDPTLSHRTRWVRERVDSNGAFRLSPVPPGVWRASLKGGTREGTDLEFEGDFHVPDAPERFADVALEGRGRLRGRVLANGEPCGGGLAYAKPFAESGPEWSPGRADSVLTLVHAYDGVDAEGRYHLQALPPGRYLVTATDMTRKGFPVGPIVVGDGEVQVPDVHVAPEGALAVEVLDPEGRRVSGARVEFSPHFVERPVPERPYSGWRTDGSGWWRHEHLAPGRWRVQVDAPGFPIAWSDAVTVEPRSTATVTVRLRRGVGVRARALSASGEPLPIAYAALIDAKGSVLALRDHHDPRLAAGAPVELHGPPGDAILMAGAPGYREARRPLTLGDKPAAMLELRLEPQADAASRPR